MQQLDVYYQHFLNMFRASLCPSSGDQDVCYCMRCAALVLLDVVGSDWGALRCRERALWRLLFDSNVETEVDNNIWLLHLVGFLSLHNLLTMPGHRTLKDWNKGHVRDGEKTACPAFISLLRASAPPPTAPYQMHSGYTSAFSLFLYSWRWWTGCTQCDWLSGWPPRSQYHPCSFFPWPDCSAPSDPMADIV